MVHPLYLAVSKTTGMRQLAALNAHGHVKDRLRVVVDSRLRGNVLELWFQPPRRWWWGLGAWHLWGWWVARAAARRGLRMVKTDVVLRKVRPWKNPTLPSSSPNTMRSRGEFCATR